MTDEGNGVTDAVCRCGPTREKANRENPQIFLICNYKDNLSAENSQSERGGYSNRSA